MARGPVGRGPRNTSLLLLELRQVAVNISGRIFSKNK